MDKLPHITNMDRTFSKHLKYLDVDKLSGSRILSDGEFRLTKPLSAKKLGEVIEEVHKCSTLAPQKLQKNTLLQKFSTKISTLL